MFGVRGPIDPAFRYYSGSRPRLDGTTIDLSDSPDIPSTLKFCDKCGSAMYDIGPAFFCFEDILEKYSL